VGSESIGSNGNEGRQGSGAIRCVLGGAIVQGEENPWMVTKRNSEPAKRLPSQNEKDCLPNWGSYTPRYVFALPAAQRSEVGFVVL
jgi:hypothetical protein